MSATEESAPRRRVLRAVVLLLVGALAALSILVLGAHWTVSGGLGARFIGARLNGLSIPGVGEVRVRGFGGDLLDLIRSDTIELVDDDGVWLTLTDVSLDWRPRSLTGRVIQIEQLRAGAAVMHRLPHIAAQETRRGGRGGGGRALPDASLVLDSLMIDRLTVEEDAFGPRGEFVVTAAAALRREGGGHVDLNAVEAEDGADALSLEARLEPDGSLAVAAAAGSAADGLIATLLGAPPGEDARLDLRANGSTGAGTGDFALRFAGEPTANGDATWDSETIRAVAHIESARWTTLRDLAQRAGPTADLEMTLTGYRTEDPLFTLTLDSDRLDAVLSGPPPTGENLRERGLTADLTLAELAAWTDGTVHADSVNFTGLVRRNDAGFGADGTLGAQRFGAFSIRAEALTGPATLRFADGTLAFEATLDGTGGGGAAGVVAQMVGPNPHVTLAGEFRGADRVLEFQRLTMESGAASAETAIMIGLHPDAEPRLTVDGSVQGLPLSALLPGIGGAMGGDFNLVRPRRGAALEIAVEGGATGINGAPVSVAGALGDSASFSLDASNSGGVLTIARAVVESPRLRLGGQGTLSGPGGYAIDLEAAIQGPTPLPGGVELAGEAMARGALSGPLDAPVIDAQIFTETLEIAGAQFFGPIAELRLTVAGGIAGDINLRADSDAGPARAVGTFSRVDGVLSAPDIDIGWADVAIAGGLTARADGLLEGRLTFSKAGGARASPWPGRAEGDLRLSARDDAQYANLVLQGEGFVFPQRQVWIDHVDIQAEGPASQLHFVAAADGVIRSVPFDAASEGVFAATPDGRSAEFGLNVQAGNVSIASQQPLRLTMPPEGGVSLHARMDVDDGHIAIDYDEGPTGALILFVIEDAPMRIVEAAQREPRLDGMLNARLRLDTRDGGMNGDVQATLRDARALDAEQDRIDMDLAGTIVDARLNATLDMRDSGGLAARAEGSLPLERGEGLIPIRVAMGSPLNGRLSADGPVDTISSILMSPEQRLAGAIQLDAALSGTARDPRINGDGALSDARFDDAVSGLVLDDLNLAVDFSNDRFRVTELSANDGRGGALSGSGAAQSAGGSWSGEVNATLRNFQAINRAEAQARISGDLSARVTPDRRVLQGTLTINEGEFAPPAAAPAGVRTLEVTEINLPPEQRDERLNRRTGPPIELDVGVTAPRRLFVRSNNLDVELSLNTHIGGTVGDVQVTGGADVVRGDAELAGARFTFDSGRARFNGDPLDGTLDFVATRDAPDLTAIIRVTGTPREPRIVLESRPPLPQDEILAQVLFGRSATDLSALEAAQLASALASMAGGGGFDALGNIRSGLGLDRLAIGQDRQGEAQISGGRYLTDDVYLELTTGAQNRSAAQVEWQALSDFAIISRFGTYNDTSISVRWRTTY